MKSAASGIFVMKDGFIRQIGTPNEVYQHPANLFVAGFIGDHAIVCGWGFIFKQ